MSEGRSGVLQFTLGLETDKFLGGLGLAGGKLLSFIGLAEGLGGVFERVWGQIEHGAQLKELSARTGESVGALYKLQSAFDAVGLSGDGVPGMILRLRRSLSGVSDEGQSTAEIFSRLNLSMNQISGMDGAEAIQSIANALAKVDSNKAAGFAQKLFGREGAGSILQISGSIKEFLAAMSSSSAGAGVFERAAASFQEIEVVWKGIRRGIDAMWAGIAAGAAPAIQRIENLIAKINFVEIGDKIGKMLDLAFRVIEGGHLGELLFESLKFGLDSFMLYAEPAFEFLGIVLAKSLLPTLNHAQSIVAEIAMEVQLQDTERALVESQQKAQSALNKQLSTGKISQAEFDAKSKSINDRTGIGLDQGFVRPGADGAAQYEDINGMEDVKKKLAEATAQVAINFQAYLEKLKTFAGSGVGASESGPDGKRKPGEIDGPPYKMEFTQLEKMGFVMRGIGNPMADHARRTADNTGKAVELMVELNQNIQSLATSIGAGIGIHQAI